MKNSPKPFFIAKRIIFFVGILTLASLVFMLLWNNLLPDIFNWKTINFWQALGLLVLSKLLWGGRHFYGHHALMHDKWRGMSANDKFEFYKKMKQKHHSSRAEQFRQENDPISSEPNGNQ